MARRFIEKAIIL